MRSCSPHKAGKERSQNSQPGGGGRVRLVGGGELRVQGRGGGGVAGGGGGVRSADGEVGWEKSHVSGCGGVEGGGGGAVDGHEGFRREVCAESG